MSMPGTDIAVRESLSETVRNWLDKMKLDVSMGPDDDGGVFGVQDSIAEKILLAETEEEIFEAVNAGTLATKEFLDTPFLLQGFGVRGSNLRNEQGEITGTGFYLLLKVKDLEENVERVLNSGAQSLMATVWRLSELGILSDTKKYPDGYPMILSGKPSAGGTVIIPKRFQAYRPSNAKASK